MAAIETALAVTLLPHFIADTSFAARRKPSNNQPYVSWQFCQGNRKIERKPTALSHCGLLAHILTMDV